MTTASIVRHLVVVLLTTLGLLGASQAVAGTATASEVRPTGLTTVLDSNKDGTVILGFVGAEWDGQAVVKNLNTDQILRTLPNGNGEYSYTAHHSSGVRFNTMSSNGRYVAYTRTIHMISSKGTPCLKSTPYRIDLKTGKIRNAATKRNGKKLKTNHQCEIDRDIYINRAGHQLVKMSNNGRYVWFRDNPQGQIPGSTFYVKDLKRGTLKKTTEPVPMIKPYTPWVFTPAGQPQIYNVSTYGSTSDNMALLVMDFTDLLTAAGVTGLVHRDELGNFIEERGIPTQTDDSAVVFAPTPTQGVYAVRWMP
jgi:hypothetical protein